ncbi:MAG: serralysin [Mariniblastus sp.]|jgi:serralysin
MAPPIVEINDTTVFINSVVSAEDLFSVSDSDDAVVELTFTDFRSGNNTGYFRKDGVAMANGSSFTIAMGELDTLEYVGGPQVFYEGFRVVARDESGNFSSPESIGRLYSVRDNVNKPHVRAPFFAALANEVIEGKDIVFGFDPDGYPLTHFRVSDANRPLRVTSANGLVTVTSFEHRFRPGDFVTIEGANESQYNMTASIAVVNDHVFRFRAPGVADGVASGDFRAFNIDGGRFQLAGVDLAQGQDFTIAADQIKDLKYLAFGPTNEENIYVQGYDGVDWSTEKRGVASLQINANRPVVQFSRASTPADQLMPIEDSFQVIDADQNSMKYYWFFNTSPHANKGDLVFKGAIMPRKSWFLVQANDIGQLYYKTGQVGDEQQIRIRAFDGRHLSTPGTLTIRSTPPIVRPEIEPNVPVVITEQLTGVPIAPLFSQVDAGPAHTAVQVFEPTTNPNSGTLRFGGTPLAGGQIHDFSKLDYESRVNFYSGDFFVRNIDDVYVREQAANGLWSGWEKVTIRTEPEYEDVLTSGSSWNGLMPINSVNKLEISYSFMQQFPDYETGEAIDGNPLIGEHFSVFTAGQRANTRLAFRGIEEFANVQFVEVADSSTNVFGGTGGIMRFGEYGIPFPTSTAGAFAFYPAFSPEAGDLWFNRLNMGREIELAYGSLGYKVLLHEMGHTMGLKHPHDGSPRLPASTDVNDFSVMSYQDPANGGQPTTYQLYDINELQDLYGANTTTRTGNDGYSIYNFWGGRSEFTETIWDAGGNDSISAVGSSRAAIIDLRTGIQNTIGDLDNNVVIAFGVDIENGIGSAHNDSLTGNNLDNMLQGRDGNDILKGHGGEDYLIGGRGDDTFEWGVADGDDVINEQSLGGNDTIRITEFPGVDTLEEDLKFRLVGDDLWVDLHIDGGQIDNSIRVIGQMTDGNRVESLVLDGTRIDLAHLSSQIKAGVDTFKLTPDSTAFGQLVVPV